MENLYSQLDLFCETGYFMFHQANEASRHVADQKAEAMNMKSWSIAGCRAGLVAAGVLVCCVRAAIACGLSRQHES
jgi:hypothetical protein